MSRTGFRLSLFAAGVSMFIGGALHPRPDTTMSFEQSTARMLAHPYWGPSHALQLIALVLMTIGCLILARTDSMSKTIRRVATVCSVSALVGTLEMAFHLAAMTEAEALRTGGDTPLLSTHLTLAVIAYPAVGLSFAALAAVSAFFGQIARPLVAPLGILGGILHAIAGPLVVVTRDQRYSPLFAGAALLAIWIALAGALEGRPRP